MTDTSILWLHQARDPHDSGEMRRLGVPAYDLEARGWRCRFMWSGSAILEVDAAVAVVPWQTLEVLPRLAFPNGPRIILEVDDTVLDGNEATLAPLCAAAGRLDVVVAHSEAAARRLRSLPIRCPPVIVIADPVASPDKIHAAACRFGLPAPAKELRLPLEPFRFWFAEAGDRIDPLEIEALAREACKASARLLVAAPREVHLWLQQLRAPVQCIESKPANIQTALQQAVGAVFFGPRTASQLRRITLARLAGAAIEGVHPDSIALTEAAVADAWEQMIAGLEGAQYASDAKGQVLLFLDLVQDLDLALPLIDALQHCGVSLSVTVSDWLLDRSPRVRHELGRRPIPITHVERAAVVNGEAPDLNGVDTLVVIAESSLSGHARSHALVLRARQLGIRTLSLQHGLENDGIHPTPGATDPVTIAADHLLAWFSAEHVPSSTPPSLRPRLVHVGRIAGPASAPADLSELGRGYEAVAAVFENLHWVRYSGEWRRQFIADCVEFAILSPHLRVILKPHHGGLWTVRNRDLLGMLPDNFLIADPSDPIWEPHTAPSLVASADLVITTPSTVAVDAVQACKPVAVAAYGLDLEVYRPLPRLGCLYDWIEFGRLRDRTADAAARATFLERTTLFESPAAKAAAYIAALAGGEANPSGPLTNSRSA